MKFMYRQLLVEVVLLLYGIQAWYILYLYLLFNLSPARVASKNRLMGDPLRW